MRQPEYENDRDRRVQNVVLDYLHQTTRRKGTQVHLAAPRSTVDYVWKLDGRTIATAELKRRNIRHDAFPDLMISMSKVRHMQRYAPLGYILILYTDGLRYKRVTRHDTFDVRHGGRTTQVRDVWDASGEDCAYIPRAEILPMPDWSEYWQDRIQSALR